MPVNRRCGDYAFSSCDDRMAIMKNETVPRRLAEDSTIEEVAWSRNIADKGYIYLDNDGQDTKVKLNDIMYAEQVQADWLQNSEGEPDYIKNKPDMNRLFLGDEFETEVSYGSLPAGTILEKGTSCMEILLRMLKRSSLIEVRYGVWADMEPNPVIYFGEYGTGYKHSYISRDDLLMDGFEASFNMGNTSESNGGYFWIAIPRNSDLVCTKLFQGGHAIDKYEGLVETTPGSLPAEESYWTLYRLEFPVISVNDKAYHVKYKFGEENLLNG